MEFECRLDSRDPELWLECFNPTFFSNLTSGEHTLEVRAYDGAENVDPTPARYTWTVGAAARTATGEHHPDGRRRRLGRRGQPVRELPLRDRADRPLRRDRRPDGRAAGARRSAQNARALVPLRPAHRRAGCELESATLRLYNESPTEGRTLEAVPLAGPWAESTLTWFNQPGDARRRRGDRRRGEGYQEWDVTSPRARHDRGRRQPRLADPRRGRERPRRRRPELPQPRDAAGPAATARCRCSCCATRRTRRRRRRPPTPATTPTTVHCGQVLTESTLRRQRPDRLPRRGPGHRRARTSSST